MAAEREQQETAFTLVDAVRSYGAAADELEAAAAAASSSASVSFPEKTRGAGQVKICLSRILVLTANLDTERKQTQTARAELSQKKLCPGCLGLFTFCVQIRCPN